MSDFMKQYPGLVSIVSKVLVYGSRACPAEHELGLELFYHDLNDYLMIDPRMEETRRALLKGAPFAADMGET